MPDGRTHEQTVNVALGEVLSGMRRSWRVLDERTGGVLVEGGRPDVLVLDASGWPVVIEAELTNHQSAEQDAIARLGKRPTGGEHAIETAIALVYPPELHKLRGEALREAIRTTDALEYALYTHVRDDERGPERLPESGWLRGSVIELAMLVHRAATPAQRVEALADVLEGGVNDAADRFSTLHPRFGEGRGTQIAEVLEQTDDGDGQTRRMAMTVLLNALIFHEALAQAGFEIKVGGRSRAVHSIDVFFALELRRGELLREWDAILDRNYWPIFGIARKLLDPTLMPIKTASDVLQPLWFTSRRLVEGGVTRSHDLTGTVFQRLIADRKFLATYYTRPEAAALLAALALPLDRAPGGADWSDAETLAATQIGDFACGTGTLLSAAYQRLSLLHELHGGDPQALHGPMMKNGLVGLDVLNIAVNLTAAMLAGSHPATPFDGECLLTMPYGAQDDGSVAIGSLDLLAPEAQPGLISQAAATTAGGRSPEDVRDLVNRVAHGKFDLVIMNPPFTRPTGQEAERIGSGNPAFAAFNTPRPVQERMQEKLQAVSGEERLGSGNAGLAAHFTDLGLRKLQPGGTLALVLPLSAMSGSEWETMRQALAKHFGNIIVLTINAPSSGLSSFSADTGMAECLLLASHYGASPREPRATFVVLNQQPSSTLRSHLIGQELARLLGANEVRRLEGGPSGAMPVRLGDERAASVLDCPIPDQGPWPLVGIADAMLAQMAYQLDRGTFIPLGTSRREAVSIPVARIEDVADRGPYHMDIYATNSDGSPRGPFDIHRPPIVPVPTYPMLWAHDAKRERRLIVEPDSEGQIKMVDARFDQESVNEKAAQVWRTATRAHYNRDLRFNSQSLIVAMTERPCIGGHAWPPVIFENPDHEYAFALWCNSTLGLLLHWWVANKTQSGRGRTSVTAIPRIPTLDVRALTDEQHARAQQAFERLREERFLPFDQIDEDEARAKLDRALLVDVLGLPESLCAPDGPMDLLRRKLAAEPQIHGGKRSRVIFTETGERTGSRRDR